MIQVDHTAFCCDYKNARRIINGLDQWLFIRQYAETIEPVLRAALMSSNRKDSRATGSAES